VVLIARKNYSFDNYRRKDIYELINVLTILKVVGDADAGGVKL